MKHFILSVLLLCAVSLSTSLAQRVEKTGVVTSAAEAKLYYEGSPIAFSEVDELLACPEGTVLAGEYDTEAGWSGFQNSDQGRPGMPTKFYQYFSECYYTVNGVRFLGMFNYWNTELYDWLGCTSRGGMDGDGNLTETVRFEISFYLADEDGKPGEVVFSKEYDLLGQKTGVLYSYTDYHIYEFTVELGETVKIESGFLSVSAVDMGDSPSCWYSVLTCGSVPGYGMIQMGDNISGSSLGMTYCLLGTGENIAQKALKLNRILAPSSSSTERHQKVQVELLNVGSEAINDAVLELWEGDELLATESVDAVIESFGTYKHVFKQRIDCSKAGVNRFRIRNITAGDERICPEMLEFTTVKQEAGEVCESYSAYCDDEYITRVAIGDIDNSSEATNYSDYTDHKATIFAGEELELAVEYIGYGATVAAWIDWNGNGSFDDDGDFISYITEGSVTISVPEGIEMSEGDKIMRIVVDYYGPTPCGEYYYGETEDYTLVVKRPETSPVLSVNKGYIEEFLNYDQKSTDLEIINDGPATMAGTLSVRYYLPFSANNRYISKPNNNELNEIQLKKGASERLSKALLADDAEYTLRYDKDQSSLISLTSGNEATFATYYPGNMLSNLAGMKISSVDVYIATASEKSEVVIYGQNKQSSHGDLIVNQAFVPVEDAWNRIELSSPITISDTDLWIGVYLEGFVPDTYQIGVDAGPAVIGFGDIVNVGGSTWWSLADLGIDSNLSIRANVTGVRTPAINWLTLGKSDYAIDSNQSESVSVALDASDLSATLYEAEIEISSNDILNNMVKVPVYLINGSTFINEIKASAASFVYIDSGKSAILVSSDKELRQVTLFDIAGAVRQRVAADGKRASMSIESINSGVYLVYIVYADGSREAVKTIITR